MAVNAGSSLYFQAGSFGGSSGTPIGTLGVSGGNLYVNSASTVTATTVNVSAGVANVSGVLDTTTANVYVVSGVPGQLNVNSSGQVNVAPSAGGTLNVFGDLSLGNSATLTASTVAVQAGGNALVDGTLGSSTGLGTLLIDGGGIMTLNGTLTTATTGTVLVQGALTMGPAAKTYIPNLVVQSYTVGSNVVPGEVVVDSGAEVNDYGVSNLGTAVTVQNGGMMLLNGIIGDSSDKYSGSSLTV